MDFRWAILYQTFFGLKLSVEETHRLFSPHINPFDWLNVRDAFSSDHFLRSMDLTQAEQVWDRSQKLGIRWSYPGLEDYPMAWTRLGKTRPLIFSYRGNASWLTHPPISIVGSRRPMRDTCMWLQRELWKFLTLAPVTVVSGGAQGVDQWAHRLALDAKRPTVCVLPSGLNRPYPYGSESLFERIVGEGGALLSTFLPQQQMRKYLFLERNRWIVGLSPVTFVVEANRRSGSSLTAKLADEEGRAVCTLPMFPDTERGRGNLDLLAEHKAHLIRDSQDLASVFLLNQEI